MKTETWKEFKINKLFEIESCKGLDAGHLKLQDHRDDTYKYEFIGRTNSNYGVQGYIKEQNFLFNNKDTITISQVGTIVAQYRNNDYYTSQNMFKLIPKFEVKENILLFLVCVLNGYLKPYFGYDSYPTLISLKKDVIKLPEKNEEPDWEYMERYIEEIKIKYINELEKDNNLKIDKALEITGLSHKDLDQDLVVKSALRYEKFMIGDLFDGISGDMDIKQHHINNKGLPVITSGLTNNGLLGLSDVSAKIIPKNTITIDMFGNVFYRNYDYKMVTHARVFALNPKFDMSDNVGLYFATMFFYLSNKFDYSNMCSYEKIKDEFIILPAIDKDTPDFDYMEKAIYIYILRKRLSLKNYLMKKK